MDKSTDVVIIGAGAAGLAAAERLHRKEKDVIVLEARDRIGGRVWTLHPESLTVPVELGAEFIHGPAEEVMEIAERENLATVDIAHGQRWTNESGRLHRFDDFFARVNEVMARLGKHTPDRSFADALARNLSISAKDRALAKQYIEGFDAADTHDVSEASLADDATPNETRREERIGRVLKGYGSIIDALAEPVRGRIRLNTIATKVKWKRGSVEVHSTNRKGKSLPVIRARRAIIAVPLGVLQAGAGELGAIEFDPPMPEKERASGKLAMGAVVRIALEFDEPFWTEPRFSSRSANDRLETMAFLHVREQTAFPVWWTPYPVRAPLLVGWRGGPGARDLARRTRSELSDEAIGSLATALNTSRRMVKRHLVRAHYHDWVNDPFSRGAYSYVRVGGRRAPSVLAKPVEGTLFFVGEHVDPEGRSGTVHGAIANAWSATDEHRDRR
jgi:monoamine oxidase